MKKITCRIIPDEFTSRVSEAFDYDFNGISEFAIPELTVPTDFNIGIIVGASGSGKSQILKGFGEEEKVEWSHEKAIVSHFSDPDEALKLLFAAGIASVPTLCKPHYALSNGEQFRATMARRLKNNAVFDEFTSVVNRETAKSLSTSISKYIKKNNLRNIVFASCHKDIVDWLEPDWVFDTDKLQYDANELSLDKFPELGEVKY